MIVDVSLEVEKRGYACYNPDKNKMMLFLGSINEILIDAEYTPFDSIEDIIEELCIHEKIHDTTGLTSNESDEKYVDRWHILLCWLDNSKWMTKEKRCKCPIDCFWRENTI